MIVGRRLIAPFFVARSLDLTPEPSVYDARQCCTGFIINVRAFRHLLGIVCLCPRMKGMLGRTVAYALVLVWWQAHKASYSSVP